MINDPGTPPGDAIDPVLLRGLTTARPSRRAVLRGGLLSLGGLVAAGCGVSGTGGAAAKKTSAASAAAYWNGKTKTGQLNFANYAQYIDVDPHDQRRRPSLEAFTKQTGIKVTYSEVIEDSATWFGKIQPQLSAGQSIGYDLMVVGADHYLTKLLELGYLVPLDHGRLPNFAANVGAVFKNPTYDPGNRFTVPWQSGITGIGYSPKRVGRKITSWNDLLDPKLKGKIGMWNDIIQLPNCALLAVGVTPEKSTQADWRKAQAWLKGQRDKGLVRSYDQGSYLDSLTKGDLYASIAYCGDIFQANLSGADLEFVVPEEGALMWTDNICIPQHAAHPVDALAYMDYIYQPAAAAMITKYTANISPVPATQALIRADAAKAAGKERKRLQAMADSPLVYPTAEDQKRLHRFRNLESAEERVWNALFEPIYQS